MVDEIQHFVLLEQYKEFVLTNTDGFKEAIHQLDQRVITKLVELKLSFYHWVALLFIHIIGSIAFFMALMDTEIAEIILDVISEVGIILSPAIWMFTLIGVFRVTRQESYLYKKSNVLKNFSHSLIRTSIMHVQLVTMRPLCV